MDESCKTCGLKEFVTENHERICISCGDVIEELDVVGRLCSLPDNDTVVDSFRNKGYEANQRLTGRIRNETNCIATKRKINRNRIVDDMRKVVKQFIKHPAAIDETMDLVESTFLSFTGRLLTCKKIGLVGACVYYMSAKHQLGISLHDICNATGIKMKVMSSCLKNVRQLCPDFEYERPNIKDLVRKYVDELANKHYDLNSLDISAPTRSGFNHKANRNEIKPLIDPEDRVVLQNRVMLLIDLFEAMHPYNQPSPQSLIVAVIYHAWKSLDTFKMIAVNLSSSVHDSPSNEAVTEFGDDQQISDMAMRVKHTISYEKFCHICNLRYSSNGYRIVSKLQSSLLMLGKYLGDVNKINLPWFLKDIIDNSAHLIQEHMRSEPSGGEKHDTIKPD